MPGKCDICGKTPQFGHNVSHSKRRTNRRWLPNTQKRALFLGGRRVRRNICSRCLRTLYKTQ
jgi:large subunit ribosomal protein L28